MYQYNEPSDTTLNVNTSYEGERIEEKIHRIVNNKEPITDSAPIIHTERKDGVQPQFNIRTDRFEIAVEAMDKVAGAYQAKRQENMNKFMDKLDGENKNKGDGSTPAQGTGDKI